MKSMATALSTFLVIVRSRVLLWCGFIIVFVFMSYWVLNKSFTHALPIILL